MENKIIYIWFRILDDLVLYVFHKDYEPEIVYKIKDFFPPRQE